MAKKRKSKKKPAKEEKAESEHQLPSGFWPQAVSVLLGLIIAPLIALGLLGVGGTLPVALSDGAKWLFGAGALFVPIILVIIALRLFRNETHRLPARVYIGMVLLLSAVGGIQAVVSTDNESAGGLLGGALGGVLGAVLATPLAIIVLLFVIVISALFILKVSFKDLLAKLGIGKTKVVEGDLDSAKAEKVAPKGEFKLNEGVPIQKAGTKEDKPKESSHKALTTLADPDWKLPGLELLNDKQDKADPGDINGNADIIKSTLQDFNIEVNMEGANVGPKVTQYTLQPPSGVRLSKITALESNIALNLAASSIRIEAPIPGKKAVGIEVPNKKAATVRMHALIGSKQWKSEGSPLAFTVGKDIAGDPIVADLDGMPHLLIAGATGSGKSVMINTLLTSFLYRNSPADLKLILVDPKQVELKLYDNIPHLLTPVITESDKCISALKWAVAEMERRYDKLSEAGKRNIQGYNQLKKEEGMPYIVIVIDELADLMSVAARDVEALIVRLAQKSRAVGIHLVLATQRPSVDVITGLIKANIPARIAFTVTQQVDSRTILDQGGAEKLLGQGDMLYMTPRLPKPKRIQGAFIDEDEIEKVVDHIRMQSAPEFDEEVITQHVQTAGGGISGGDSNGADDNLYKDAVRVVTESGKASASLLQRRLRIGYGRAARLIDYMEEQGIVGPPSGSRPREVLISSVDDAFNSDS